jgi:hypothetical protein
VLQHLEGGGGDVISLYIESVRTEAEGGMRRGRETEMERKQAKKEGK